MQRDRHIAVWLRMLAEKEIKYRRDAKKLFKAQGSKAANAYKVHGLHGAEEVLRAGVKDWQRVSMAHYTTAIKDFSDYTREQIVGSKSIKQNFQHRVSQYILKRGLENSKQVTETTMLRARKVITVGQQNGDPTDVIADDLESEIGGDDADFRSNVIARTEVHDAATYAMQETAEDVQTETGVAMTREWVAVEDDRTREAHSEADGQEVGMDEPFEVDDEELDRPGDPNGSPENIINCRCTVIYHTESGDEVDEGDIDDSGE